MSLQAPGENWGLFLVAIVEGYVEYEDRNALRNFFSQNQTF